MQFVARGIEPPRPTVIERLCEAVDEASLRRSLEAEGFVVITVRTVRGRLAAPRVRRFDVAAWCRELASLLRAGMTVVEAVETMQLQANAAGAERQRALLRHLHEGRSLSQAMGDAGGFPQVLVAGVLASERTGRLADALDDFLHYDRQLRDLKRHAVSAAVYPAVVVAVGLLITLFLLLYVLPRFARMYGSFRGEISTATRVMLWVSNALGQAWPVVLAVLVLGGLGIGVAHRRGWTSLIGQQLIDVVPPLRRARQHFARASLFNAMMLTLRGGYPLVEALLVCSRLHLGRDIDMALDTARRAIEQGAPASRAFRDTGLVDEVGARLLAVGERGGQFVQVLTTLAERHAEAFATFVQRATRIVEPVLLLTVAVMVGGIVIMMYMPVFDIASGLQ
jgi:general secretion pathway protein F